MLKWLSKRRMRQAQGERSLFSTFLTLLVLALVAPVARAETVYVTDHLRVALRAEPTAEAATVVLLNSGTALEVLARDERMLQVRTQDAEGWIDARYVMTQAPAAAQLIAARTHAQQLQAQLNQAQAALAEQTAKATELETQGAPAAPTPAVLAPGLLVAWGVSAAAMLGIGFLVGMARVRRNYRKRLGGMTLGI